jgi:hypothetical protein
MRSLLLTLVLLVGGCAHAHLEQFHWESGNKICEIEAWVLGTGETEQVTNACGDYAYATRNTGISDNGKEALGVVAEGVAQGMAPDVPDVWELLPDVLWKDIP